LTVKKFKNPETSAVEQGGEDGFFLLGLDRKLDMSNPAVKKFLRQRVYKFSFEITEETNKKLAAALSEGVDAGESIPQLQKRVLSLFDDMSKYRSERIARSEVIRASNFGTNEAYKQSGVVEKKIWLTAFDERTCDECVALDGESVGLDDEFDENDYEQVKFAPLHPNCRCTIIPRVKS
jgi:SPP1 gp7 family putative phage head morphogenesis protein